VGKGSSIDGYDFKEGLCKIGLNDVGGVVDVDYVVVGPDEQNAYWLNRSDVHDRSVVYVCDSVWRWEESLLHGGSYRKWIKRNDLSKCDHEHWYFKGSKTSSAGLYLAKLLGYSRVICVGFGDGGYSDEWIKTEGRNSGIEIVCKGKKKSIGECEFEIYFLEMIGKDLGLEICQ